jgi:hypothetical protein
MKLIYPILLIVALSSCKQEKNWHDKIILSDDQVTMVASVDLLGIINKMDISNSQLPIDQKIMLNGVLSSFDSDILGFKLEGGHKFFLVPELGEQNGGLFLSGDILDLAKFNNSITSTFGGDINEKDGINFINAENFNLTIGHDDEKFIAGISLDNSFTESKIISYFKSSNISEDSSDDMASYLERNDDFSYFLSADKLINAVAKMNIPFYNLQDLPIPNVNSMIALNFNDGNVSIESEIISNDNESNTTIAGNGLDEKFVNFLTDDNEIIGFALANLNKVEIINQLEKLKDQDEIYRINRELKRLNVTLSEVINMFNGQVSLSLIDLPLKSQNSYNNDWSDDEWENEVNDVPEVIFNAGISNQLALTELINKGNVTVVENKVASSNGLNILIKDNVLHLSSKSDILDKILSNNTLGTCSMVDKSLINEPAYFELVTNLDYFPTDIIDAIDEDNSELAIRELFDQVERVYFHGNGVKSSFNLDFSNKNRNGLAQLIDIVSERLAALLA